MMTIEEKVKKAAEYIKNGDPYRDVMSSCDVMEAIEFFAKRLSMEETRQGGDRCVPVEEIKDALWWMEEGLNKVEMGHTLFTRTSESKKKIERWLSSL